MKTVLIPLYMHTSDTCCDCQPGHSFKADWCLDLHGFLSREEFASRLNQINNHVKGVELMTFGNGRINVLKLGFCMSIKFASLFSDNALIILEINDALSDLTANTVRVNIEYETIFPVENTPMVNVNHNV
ncbi:4565_t:CDS:2 [Racocetra fulgida]|uniref:4565_t:CDS:1 n=1 Tax=Racocetra fulgida TaxID=60492 RepID=A0A9N8W2G3_9GLOM|nr:4565_t:CDS:2 [Racocetra fulgida]